MRGNIARRGQTGNTLLIRGAWALAGAFLCRTAINGKVAAAFLFFVGMMMLTRILIAVGVLALLNFYIALRVINRWPWAGQHVAVASGMAFAFFLLQLLGPFGDRVLFPKLQDVFAVPGFYAALDWISYTALGAMSCLFIYTLVTDIVWIFWLLITRPQDNINFDRRALITLGAVTLGTAALGVGQAVSGPQVRRVDIPLRNLPPAFDGFTIAQISDLHVSSMIGRDYTENVVAMTNALKPDLIALTGDFIDGTIEELHDKIAPIADLQAPQGKFFITGNHEYYWDAPGWERHFTQMGARVLSNEHQIITRDGSAIILAGVNDYSTLHMGYPALACSPAKALQGAPSGLVKILLAHQPATYHMAHEAGFDLQLSGHTHAGQYFPFNLFIGFFQRYYKGLNRHKNMWVYVNSGTGWWGPPLRTGNPSEITLLTLRPEQPGATIPHA